MVNKKLQKFAEEQQKSFRKVDAYRADVASLLGIGRKKLIKFPSKILVAGGKNRTPERTHFTLRQEESAEPRFKFSPPPTLLTVLPTDTAQKTIVMAMMQHLLLHHGQLDDDTIFAYGGARLFTFFSAGVAAQLNSANDPRLAFLSHQNRRHSELLNKLFHFRFLRQKKESDGSYRPVGHHMTSFLPVLPSAPKISHEKKLAELSIRNGFFYAASLAPRDFVRIGGKVLCDKGNSTDTLPPSILLPFSHFLEAVGGQPNAKPALEALGAMWPETSRSSLRELEELKIGAVPAELLEFAFLLVQEELQASEQYKSYLRNLRIKRAVPESRL
ncbi:unnamed protein product [Caenorhabditis auriculariae]|uniref:Uncharacterized protein n=1 Tax=Caenorhabditis auriculariae TaxID=2777116 RepID=A0A8S1HEG8_9PELO|nr:unnamed protein product [Caenorhabditis auriculariae]